MLVILLGRSGSAQDPLPIERPHYQLLRFNEDWSMLRDVPDAQKTDFWDSIKYIPLNEDGSTWLSTGGSARMRWEGWHNFGFGEAPNNDDTFLLWRILAHADLHAGESFRAFVQGKHAYSTDRDLPGGNRPIDRDTIALEQAFVDVVVQFDEQKDLTIRPGRQALEFGAGRLVSPLLWANTLRRWDGVSAIYGSEEWDLHGFYSVFVPVQKYDFNDGDSDLPFWGVYADGTVPGSDVGLDLYYLGYGNYVGMGPTWNGTMGDETRNTFGARAFGRAGNFDYDAEFAYQFGEVGSADVSAYMFGGELGYTFDAAWSPRPLIGLDVGSGDNNPGGNVQTFNQLYPLAHAYLGYADVIGRQNLIAPSLGVVAKPGLQTTLGLRAFWFWRESTKDAVYTAGGVVLRPGSAGSDSYVGAEVDVILQHKFDRHTTVLLGYNRFFAGSFIEESGASDDIDYVFAQVEYTF